MRVREVNFTHIRTSQFPFRVDVFFTHDHAAISDTDLLPLFHSRSVPALLSFITPARVHLRNTAIDKCMTPTDNATSAYELIETDLSIATFKVAAECSAGYAGVPIVGVCGGNGQEYTLSGCDGGYRTTKMTLFNVAISSLFDTFLLFCLSMKLGVFFVHCTSCLIFWSNPSPLRYVYT